MAGTVNETNGRKPLLGVLLAAATAALTMATPGGAAARCTDGGVLWAYDRTNGRIVTLGLAYGQPIVVNPVVQLPAGEQLEDIAWSPAGMLPATLYGLRTNGTIASISLSTGALTDIVCAACSGTESAFAMSILDASGVTQFLSPVYDSITDQSVLRNASAAANLGGSWSSATFGGLDTYNCLYEFYFGLTRGFGTWFLVGWRQLSPGVWGGPGYQDLISAGPSERAEGLAIDASGEFFAATQNGRIYSFRPSVDPFPPPIFPNDYGVVPGGFDIRGLSFGPTAPPSVPTPTPTPAMDLHLGFKAKSSSVANNTLPKNWRIQLDDQALANSAADDPENYEISKVLTLLNPGRIDTVQGPLLPDVHYIRYQVKESAEGVGAAVAGKFPKAVAHVKRRWELQNRFGTISVDSSKVTSLLLPSGASEAGVATAPGQDRTHFKCYKIKVARRVVSDQTPEIVPGSGGATFFRAIQAYLVDSFDDCSSDTIFAGSPVAGMCLYDVKKPLELCNPVVKTVVDPPRTTAAVIGGSNPEFAQSLLCYRAKLSSKVSTATLGGGFVGQRIGKLQSKHVKRRLKDGSAVSTAPGNQFPAPTRIDTVKAELICVPTDVLAVNPL